VKKCVKLVTSKNFVKRCTVNNKISDLVMGCSDCRFFLILLSSEI